MAFKIPPPTYDAEVVEKIEEFLDQDYTTEVEYTERYPDDGIQYTFARGRGQKSYSRPMFQVLPNGAFSGGGQSVTPCQCDRFDRSWNCELHPEISWDTERRRWNRPCTGDRTSCECTSCHERRTRAQERADRYISMGTDGLRPPQGLIDGYLRSMDIDGYLRSMEAMAQGACPCAGCRAGRGEAPTRSQPIDGRRFFDQATQEREQRRQYENQARLYMVDRIDQNQGRPGYHYDALTDRWLRDTSDPLGDFRVEADPDSPVPGAIRLMGLDRVPDEIMVNLGPSREDFLAALPSFSATLTGTFTGSFTLEIESETEQGAGPLAIEVEPSDGSTATA